MGNFAFYANTYSQIYDSDPASKVWSTKEGRPATRDEVLKDYLKKSLGTLVNDNGKPLMDDAALERFKKVIDISIQIELDKTGNRADKDFQDRSGRNTSQDYGGGEKHDRQGPGAPERQAGDAPSRATLVLWEQECSSRWNRSRSWRRRR